LIHYVKKLASKDAANEEEDTTLEPKEEDTTPAQ